MPLSVTKRQLAQLLTGLCLIKNTNQKCYAFGDSSISSEAMHNETTQFSFLVGGTKNSKLAYWSKKLSASFSKNFPSEPAISLDYTTGHDSVTAANRFDTRITPDGNTALITTGNAFIAALAGDKRVHYDYERWIPVLSATIPSVVIARQPFHNSIPDLLRNRVMKIAVSTLIGKELPTLLGIELLQINTVPILGLTDHNQAVEALKNGQIDALQISSTEGLKNLPNLLKKGFHVFFSFEKNSDYSPSFFDVYSKLHHFLNGNTLYQAWQALSMASRLHMAVVLPMLTASPLVSKWRMCASKIANDPEISNFASQHYITLQTDPVCNAILSDVSPSITAALALKRWLNIKIPQWYKE
ncbi:hypothetical protein COMNV_00926 [Commensalibacter sp. Nvir]|uniref:hypothetical protein n=1 Tax=Commensalibacter sp. Nvir TaxID=3069817 RepID=UPI002D3D9551|nr:hypothetical protein COMNV_00926 [Commensalibacter sp. Nvir]